MVWIFWGREVTTYLHASMSLEVFVSYGTVCPTDSQSKGTCYPGASSWLGGR